MKPAERGHPRECARFHSRDAPLPLVYNRYIDGVPTVPIKEGSTVEQIRREIRDWLWLQPAWLQEAAHRLLTGGNLTEADAIALCEMLRTPDGQKAVKRYPFDELGRAPELPGELRLVSIGEVHGLENLAPKKPLVFGRGNLTVIYGQNGSGKSSYTRILKRAAGNPRAHPLKSNVFQVAPAVQKCRITFGILGQEDSVEWVANDTIIDAMRAVDVFDSEEATHYLFNESAASYIPPLVALFQALAVACDQIKALLQSEEDALVTALPVPPANYAATPPIQAYRALRPDMGEVALFRLVTCTAEEAQAHRQLTERLSVDDPAATAKKKRATKAAVERIASTLNQAARAYGAEHLLKIVALRAAAINQRKAATEGAQVAAAELDGIGEGTWRALWAAARAYSQEAYPDQAFPVVENARCVLCHQHLDAEARVRLVAFETFVQGKLEGDAQAADVAYAQGLDALPTIPTAELILTQIEAAGLPADTWAPHLQSTWDLVAAVRAQALVGAVQQNDVAQMLQATEKVLLNYAERVGLESIQCDKDAMGFDRVQAASMKLSLDAKQWVAQQAEAVRIEMGRLKHVKQLGDWKALANSRHISTQSALISEKAITQAYVTRFNQELRLLGANHIQVELIKSKTEKGQVMHRLRLKAAKLKQTLDRVLSEGERRVLSLAAFLADVSDKPHAAPFIFDDPISSLDHDFEWAVASRLTELSKSRQVIVFTHRLSLYGAMEDVAKKLGDAWTKQHLALLSIERFGGGAGHPVDQATWSAKTETANNILLDRLGAAKRAGQADGGEAYRIHARGICGDFRKLLERTVEDDLLFAVVKRHRKSVTTDNKLAALPLIDYPDCELLDGLMTKYSCYEHSQSQEAPVFIPEEAELRVDLEALKHWRLGFVQRRKLALA